MDRKPATIPMAKADKAKARSEDIRPIYIGQLLSQGTIIFGIELVEGSTATLGCAPSRMLDKRTAQAGVPVHLKSALKAKPGRNLFPVWKYRQDENDPARPFDPNAEAKHHSPIHSRTNWQL